MNKITLGLTALAAVLISGAANAAEQTAPLSSIPFYLGAKAGLSFENLRSIINDSNIANPATVAQTSQSNTVGSFGAALGLNFAKWGAPVRGEIEYSYRTDFGYNPNPNFTNAAVPTKSSNTLNTQTVLVNAYYDIDTGTKFTPFVGGGLGAAITDVSTTGTVLATGMQANHSSSATTFAWALGGGVSYALDSHWNADLSYRYLDAGSPKFIDSGTTALKGDLSSNELLLGVRYQF